MEERTRKEVLFLNWSPGRKRCAHQKMFHYSLGCLISVDNHFWLISWLILGSYCFLGVQAWYIVVRFDKSSYCGPS